MSTRVPWQPLSREAPTNIKLALNNWFLDTACDGHRKNAGLCPCVFHHFYHLFWDFLKVHPSLSFQCFLIFQLSSFLARLVCVGLTNLSQRPSMLGFGMQIWQPRPGWTRPHTSHVRFLLLGDAWAIPGIYGSRELPVSFLLNIKTLLFKVYVTVTALVYIA